MNPLFIKINTVFVNNSLLNRDLFNELNSRTHVVTPAYILALPMYAYIHFETFVPSHARIYSCNNQLGNIKVMEWQLVLELSQRKRPEDHPSDNKCEEVYPSLQIFLLLNFVVYKLALL